MNMTMKSKNEKTGTFQLTLSDGSVLTGSPVFVENEFKPAYFESDTGRINLSDVVDALPIKDFYYSKSIARDSGWSVYRDGIFYTERVNCGEKPISTAPDLVFVARAAVGDWHSTLI